MQGAGQGGSFVPRGAACSASGTNIPLTGNKVPHSVPYSASGTNFPPDGAAKPWLPRDLDDAQPARRALGLQPLGPAHHHAAGVDPREGTLGHDDLIGFGGVSDASGDVDVDPEVVATERARATPVHSRTH